MEKKITLTVDANVYEKFFLSLNLTNDSVEQAIETCMCWYISMTFEEASQAYHPKTVAKQSSDAAKACSTRTVFIVKRYNT